MRSFRTLIVDEDQSARQGLVDVLRERNEIDIIGECTDGTEAAEIISSEKPALVFMEIEMPKISGFDVIENVTNVHRPLVVFTSSHRDFAVEAFEFEALDYIQKPFISERIQKTLDRLVNRLGNGIAEVAKDNIGTFFQNQDSKPLKRFIIKQAGEYHLVRTKNIIWIEADGNYSKIMTSDKRFMVRYTLSGFEGQLSSEKFYRISRSQIVNLDYVIKIKDHIYGNYIVELENGVSLKMSKNYKHLFEVLKNF
ncbi:MAG: LytTR family DNA-binding domain-containing protein [Fodinibius sp.]|nr:LytTR family DNA-binding domain-containing protein [Fodinibius sp.]